MSSPKVVIFCGGFGMRMREHRSEIPKPLVPVGGEPILWHVMKLYETAGHRDFVLPLGYKGEMIRDFFEGYARRNSVTTIGVRTDSYDILKRPKEDWDVTLVNTGEYTETGNRLYQVRDFLGDAETFMITYGDGVSNVSLDELYKEHIRLGTDITITGVRQHSKYGQVKEIDGVVTDFRQKPLLDDVVNGGFMVANRTFLDHPALRSNAPIEDVLIDLAPKGKVGVYTHDGFWHSMDSARDVEHLEHLWRSGNPPWKTWE